MTRVGLGRQLSGQNDRLLKRIGRRIRASERKRCFVLTVSLPGLWEVFDAKLGFGHKRVVGYSGNEERRFFRAQNGESICPVTRGAA